ncbi:glycogen debranching N-terminal domain-containing protein, partial [Micromonospora sp. NPDC023633]|uniref:glycogen debranching N-terminal domain-containing protein n=1 Tax=Micromonospora sp. NPDC023633 TaxID=3154320 RepID=UPI0033DE24D6
MTRVRNLRVRPDLLYVASGWSTLVTDVRGRITGADPQGFFARNTRVLSTERLSVDGREPVPFSTANVAGHAQLSYAALGDGETLPSRAAYLLVERFVGEGLRTRLTVVSYAAVPLDLRLRIHLAADFADTSEAETGRRVQSGAVDASWDDRQRELRLTYRCDGLDRAVAIGVRADMPVRYADAALAVDVAVPPGQSRRVELLVEPVFDGRRLAAPPPTFAEPGDAAARARGA